MQFFPCRSPAHAAGNVTVCIYRDMLLAAEMTHVFEYRDKSHISPQVTYAHVCSRMLTYAHVCSRMLLAAEMTDVFEYRDKSHTSPQVTFAGVC